VRFAKVIAAACLVAASTGVTSAQVVEPLKVLEGERRDRLELDNRLAREAAARRQKEKADEAARTDARQTLQRATAPAVSTPPTASPAGEPGPASSSDLPGHAAPASSTGEAAAKNVGVAAAPAPAAARVLISVDKARQRMLVTVNGKLRHSWAVSTGRTQYETPTGTFRPRGRNVPVGVSYWVRPVETAQEWRNLPFT
jgi:hypothetical protein